MYEYWIGRDVDFRKVWNDYESGLGYIDKYHSMEVYLIRITFKQYSSDLPLFNHEAVYKTLKGYFHELKLQCLSQQEYNVAGPLFLYDVERASGKWSFLGELRHLILLGTTLTEEKIFGQRIENFQKKLQILRENFGDRYIYPQDFQNFMAANTGRDVQLALENLYMQGLIDVEISQEPFMGDIVQTKSRLVSLNRMQNETDYLAKLRYILTSHFNEPELRNLAFDLGVNYDALRGQGTADKARELVDYFRQRNQIGKLVRKGVVVKRELVGSHCTHE
jgi:hypothetical protein